MWSYLGLCDVAVVPIDKENKKENKKQRKEGRKERKETSQEAKQPRQKRKIQKNESKAETEQTSKNIRFLGGKQFFLCIFSKQNQK